MTTSTVNGPAIRAIRERSGLSVRAVVAALWAECGIKIHINSFRNIETGAKGASPELAAAIARVLKVPIVAILAAPTVEPEVTAP